MALNYNHLKAGSDVVYDPSTGTNYTWGSDYEISYLDGEITVLSSGSIVDATTYEVDYQYETRGSYADPSVANPRQAPKQPVPGLTSTRACEQVAYTPLGDYLRSALRDDRAPAD